MGTTMAWDGRRSAQLPDRWRLANGYGNGMGWAESLLAECSVNGLRANVYDDSMGWAGVGSGAGL